VNGFLRKEVSAEPFLRKPRVQKELFQFNVF